MAQTWTNTSKTDLILPHGTVVPAGLTVLERMEVVFDDLVKNPLMKLLMDTGVLKFDDKAQAPAGPSIALFNGGPIANSANVPTMPAAALAPLPASDPGPGSTLSAGSASEVAPKPQVVKNDDGTHKVVVGDDVIHDGLTKKEAEALAADPAKAPA